MYIKKRWILLFLVVVIGVAIGYIYNHFFQENEAEQVCCKKHYIKVPSVLTITESTPIPILDSSKANQQITYNILNQVQEGLMRLGSNDVPVPGLAESYQVSPDYRTYTFTIRKNARWSDGKPVTANDFKYAWERALNPANEYEYAFLFYPIHNAQAYSLGKVGADQVGVSVTDESHLTVQLDKPDPNFLSLVTLTPFLPIRSDLVEKYGESYATSPETMSFTGPFVLQSFTPQKAELIKNKSYWDQAKVKLTAVDINVEVDQNKQIEDYKSELTSNIKSNGINLRNSKDYRSVINVSRGVSDFLEMNEAKMTLKNESIRKAITLQINNKEIQKFLSDGSVAAKGVIPPVLKTNNNKVINSKVQITYSQKAVKDSLSKGYQELGVSKLPDLKLLTYNDNRSILLAKEIKKQLGTIGINVTIERLDPSEKYKKESEGDFDLSISEWSLKYNDPDEFLSLWKSNSDTNISRFADPHYDSLLNQASLESNPTKRTQLLQEAERYLIVDKAVVMPLIYVNDLRLQKPYVKNVLYHPFGADYSLKWATYQPPKQVEATK
ncbi:peptide ABC transporter substrate-binding protein [Shimazuella sp. AN120528]|uniref:peptide ABC transporter substrate-binding protein n=1 Tax=Shimazuella soli TaxID=1892854 RepID=UPI001F0F64F7|nr:peptide ABC transporter substrate-binding protein [Shimazuella soli]MCH5585712.1 peptide ABC transporter substrate-binding protein [Shimazuella soli]